MTWGPFRASGDTFDGLARWCELLPAHPGHHVTDSVADCSRPDSHPHRAHAMGPHLLDGPRRHAELGRYLPSDNKIV